jgi:TRAP-type uncharacterized transport system substrate-binding protein
MSASSPGADLAFVRAGNYDIREEAVPNLHSLGNMYLRPLWIFYRQDASIATLAELRGRTVGVVASDTDAAAIAPRLLELDQLDRKDVNLIFDGMTPLTVKLLDGSVSALFIHTHFSSLIVQMLLQTPGVSLFNDRNALYHTNRLQDLVPVTLPARLVNGTVPLQDTTLLAANMALVAQAGLHPAVTSLLLAEAESVFRGKGTFHAAGTFPNGVAASPTELPLAPAAADFYRSGVSTLMRYLPFRVATLLPRLLPALLIVFVLFLPLFVLAPRLYDLTLRMAAAWNRRGGGAKADQEAQAVLH